MRRRLDCEGRILALMTRASRPVVIILTLGLVHIAGVPVSAQHQGHPMPPSPATKPAPAKAAPAPGAGTEAFCQARARAASQRLEALTARLDLARLTDNTTEMRAAAAAADRALAQLQQALSACKGARVPPAPPSPSAPMAGMDHSKMATAAQPPAAAAAKPGGVDHAAMGHTTPPDGAAAAPTTVRQISGPAEAALQAFTDAMQIGNRDVAVEWLAANVAVTDGEVRTRSREEYVAGAMHRTMDFLKTAKVVMQERQVHPDVDSAHIVTTSRVTGRDGNVPVDIVQTESAVLRRLPEGWRIVELDTQSKSAQ
ncbi:MAG: nuclear transport factor 2 family protein [Acidobacteriota bacterium]|nr:nuclear transport factor 2 family protein [Acidobacteriota bacterium]